MRERKTLLRQERNGDKRNAGVAFRGGEAMYSGKTITERRFDTCTELWQTSLSPNCSDEDVAK